MTRKLLPTAILAALIALPANASVQNEMTSWFNEMGSYANVTMPQAVQGQTSTVYTGGNLYMRSPIRNYQLASINPPSMRAGCGGIDFFAGSFSFINSEQLTALLRNIANNAVGYAFMLAVEAISPDLAGLLKYLQDQIAKLNNLNINSCAAAENLVAMTPLPGWAAERAKQRQSAQSNGAGLVNAFTDSFGALTNFLSNAGTRRNLVNQVSNADPNMKKYLKPGNVMWEALSRTDAPDEIKEIMMSLTGTIIVTATGEEGEPKVEYKGPLLTFNQLIGSPRQNTTRIDLWKCLTYSEGDDGNPACYVVSDVTQDITPFAYRVKALMEKGMEKISTRDAQAFTDVERYFLTGSATPLWRLIAASANTPAGGTMISDEYALVVAAEVTQSFVGAMMREVGKAIANSKGMQSDTNLKALNDMRAELHEINRQIGAEMQNIYQKAIAVAETQRKIQWVHETMMRSVSSDIAKSLTVFGQR